MKTINWNIHKTDQEWAFGVLARHVMKRLKDFRHVLNEPNGAHINMYMTPTQFNQRPADNRSVLHLDGHRVFQREPVKLNQRPRILNVIWELGGWSWGLCYSNIQLKLNQEYNMRAIEYKPFARSGCQLPMDGVDFVLCQNITQVNAVPDEMKCRTITRLGGIMNFAETGSPRINFYFDQMRQCAAIIATNEALYDIAIQVNPNTYLIPNGIDIKAWCPRSGREWRFKKPVIGFVGNVTNLPKVRYKGYDLVCKAARDLGLELRKALFKSEQIPHDKMKELFYDEIDLLILPTDGEGSSNTIIEALACGVPVITTRTSGYHGERMTDGENVVFCEKSLQGVKQSITRFLGNRDFFDKISAGGRAFAVKNHDINLIAARYREVFERYFV